MLREVIVPAGVLAIVASLLLPLPPAFLDFMLVVNLLLALVLLASSLYISEPLKLSALPTMLLLATLYRLALNVSTTRLILNTGDAGRMIAAFGDVVIQGNLIVGAVVFLIITIIQFLVIAKGAERVAEVSARFTLDALPGKQMSIDADVRAGILDMESARAKRQELQTESRFYGALDGAMKFIKGDAIAGLIVTAINIVGGLLVGIFTRDLDVMQALRQYTVLTVGDGLVSQIPALLNALAAAIIVTRVARGDGQSLAQELPHQLSQLQSVRLLAAATAVLLSFIPQMPMLPFLIVAAVLLAMGPIGRGQSDPEIQSPPVFTPRPPSVLAVEMSAESGKRLLALGTAHRAVDELRQRIYNSTGLILLLPEFSSNQECGSCYRILMRGVLVKEAPLPQEPEAALEEILRELETIVLSRRADFIDDILTRRTLDRFDREAPELVAAVVPSVVSVTQLTEVLRSLAREKLSIRNFDLILQAMAEAGPKVRSERALLEEARIALGRVIAARYRRSNGELRCIPLAPVYDLSFAAAEREGKVLDVVQLEPLLQLISNLDLGGRVLAASRGARRLLREALLQRGIDVPVIAHEEIVECEFVRYERPLAVEGGAEVTVLEALAA
jgi:type III secretion protein V